MTGTNPKEYEHDYGCMFHHFAQPRMGSIASGGSARTWFGHRLDMDQNEYHVAWIPTGHSLRSILLLLLLGGRLRSCRTEALDVCRSRRIHASTWEGAAYWPKIYRELRWSKCTFFFPICNFKAKLQTCSRHRKS